MAYSIRYHYRRSSFVSLLLMRNFLNDDGPLNGLLQTFHITNGPLSFLTDPLWAKFSIIFVNMWIGIPFTMLVATGIIMNLPTEQIKAAEIDGASKIPNFQEYHFPTNSLDYDSFFDSTIHRTDRGK